MGPLPRLMVGLTALAGCLLAGTMTASAAAGAKPATAHPAPAAAPVHQNPPSAAPLVFQLSPLKVDPARQTNIVIIGQHLSAATRVLVGGHPATTIESPDNQTLLVKLPGDLSTGSYQVAVTNESGTALADDQLVIDQSQAAPSSMATLAGGGFLLLLVLVMRLSRTPGLA